MPINPPEAVVPGDRIVPICDGGVPDRLETACFKEPKRGRFHWDRQLPDSDGI